MKKNFQVMSYIYGKFEYLDVQAKIIVALEFTKLLNTGVWNGERGVRESKREMERQTERQRENIEIWGVNETKAFESYIKLSISIKAFLNIHKHICKRRLNWFTYE